MTIHFYNSRILQSSQIIQADLWVKAGKIVSAQKHADQRIDARGALIVPGFLDLQLNGAFGCDFTSMPETISKVAAKLGRYGVTAFLPTIISSLPSEYRKILPIAQRQIGPSNGAEVLGLHLEGPCFNPLQVKAHCRDAMRVCADFTTPEECYGPVHGVKMVTLAPELPGALNWIDWLSSHNIIASAGHSLATAQQMREASQAGMQMATHLFNAMTPFSQRQPGMSAEILNQSKMYFSLIADGMHLDPLVIQLAWKCHPLGLILVSDAMAGLGQGEGVFALAGQQIDVRGGQAHILGTKTLAGSVLSLDQMLRNFIKFTGASLIDGLKAVSEKPAKLLGLFPKKGSLEIGADADLVLLIDNLQVKQCYSAGKCIFKS